MGELRQDPPDYVIDATGPGNLGFEDIEKEGIGSFPELAQFVAEDYTSVGRAVSGTSCPRIYASHVAVAEFAKLYVPLAGVSASTASDTPGAPQPGEVFQACWDSPLPAGQRSTIQLDLGGLQHISAVEFLDLPKSFNTALGAGITPAPFRATVRALANGNVAMETPVTVPPFPRWVAAAATSGVFADRIVIDVESGSGGFTWIRVRR